MGIRVLLVDDHKIVREGLNSLLSRESSIQVVGEADNGRSSIQMTRELTPDVVIMDISMPDMNGIEATQRIRNEMPACKVLALSMHADRRFVIELLKAGANGYMMKDCAADDLVAGIHTVSNGDTYLSPKISNLLVDDYMKRIQDAPLSVASVLSTREREVLQLLAEGNNTKEIAFSLDISIKTVESHRTQIMKKLKVHSIAELTKLAIREGLTSLT
ncbi:response regulator transcription factor [Geobacter pelophilus]|uniref:Response regulator transcription factor n=1 Tax=Geoanaerobacter pelophilus TaxID=60036 RepID=A0AAW4L949_9BACT|nr:response regulator transcription factor [Geoanaerobacter pelophilus]MBT0666662.1 response regulator transcription factor [Geoanaerobacter pelophilus]